ncbi:MAG: hypothetical protein ABI586_02955 [Candidatus Nanopelagicales bacterium]
MTSQAGTDVESVPSKLILTAAGPSMQPVLHDLSLPTFERFAKRWGYDVRAVKLETDGSAADPRAQAAKWSKIGLLREALAHYELVLWLDADVLLLRDDEDVAMHLGPSDIHALALEHVPTEHRINPNTGVWLLRGPDGIALLDAIESVGQQPGPWSDQGAVLAALGWDRGDDRYRWARPGPGNEWLAATSWLPPGWNQPYVGPRDANDSYNSAADSYVDRPTVSSPHALHFMGMTPHARYEHMKRTVAARPELVALAT